MLTNLLSQTNSQKILQFLIRDPEKQYLACEIQSGTKVSKAGVNAALRELGAKKLILRETRGKVFFYQADIQNNPLLVQMKVLQTVSLIQPLVAKIKSLSKKIVLFGSCARGEDTPASDIDLFIVTDSEDEVKPLLSNLKITRKLQSVVRSPLAYVEMEKKDREFFEELSRGLILWEAKE